MKNSARSQILAALSELQLLTWSSGMDNSGLWRGDSMSSLCESLLLGGFPSVCGNMLFAIEASISREFPRAGRKKLGFSSNSSNSRCFL